MEAQGREGLWVIKTPHVKTSRLHLKKFIFLFILILPMGFIHELKYMAIPVIMIIYYAFVGLQLT